MKQTVIQRLQERFGAPTRQTDKAAAWEFREDFGFVLRLDEPRGDVAEVWLPHPIGNQSLAGSAEFYPGEQGRFSNAYATPSLEEGKPAYRVTIENDDQLGTLIEYIASRR